MYRAIAACHDPFHNCAHYLLGAATESNPISVCAFCSENHAGVRWMVHSSHDDRHFFDSKRINTINIDFQCQDPQGNNIMVSLQFIKPLQLLANDSVSDQSWWLLWWLSTPFCWQCFNRWMALVHYGMESEPGDRVQLHNNSFQPPVSLKVDSGDHYLHCGRYQCMHIATCITLC